MNNASSILHSVGLVLHPAILFGGCLLNYCCDDQIWHVSYFTAPVGPFCKTEFGGDVRGGVDKKSKQATVILLLLYPNERIRPRRQISPSSLLVVRTSQSILIFQSNTPRWTRKTVTLHLHSHHLLPLHAVSIRTRFCRCNNRQADLQACKSDQEPLAENQGSPSLVSVGNKRSLLDGIAHNGESPSSPAPISIKRRLVRPRKIRQSHGDVSPPASVELQMPKETLAVAESEPLRPALSPSPPLQSSKPPSRLPSPSTSTPSFADAPLPPPPRSRFAPPRSAHPPLVSCRSVYNYTRLNHIEEGTYGVVFRARCNDTGEIYALKKLKLDEEKQGFPITSLREVMALMIAGGHENVVGIREIVVGDTLNQ